MSFRKNPPRPPTPEPEEHEAVATAFAPPTSASQQATRLSHAAAVRQCHDQFTSLVLAHELSSACRLEPASPAFHCPPSPVLSAQGDLARRDSVQSVASSTSSLLPPSPLAWRRGSVPMVLAAGNTQLPPPALLPTPAASPSVCGTLSSSAAPGSPLFSFSFPVVMPRQAPPLAPVRRPLESGTCAGPAPHLERPASLLARSPLGHREHEDTSNADGAAFTTRSTRKRRRDDDDGDGSDLGKDPLHPTAPADAALAPPPAVRRRCALPDIRIPIDITMAMAATPWASRLAGDCGGASAKRSRPRSSTL